jgi:2-polyprenyl-3-methyl-5-hydroxy-6-metoxy-1,4-benzoquinol methylase
MTADWGTRDWFEEQFSSHELDEFGDKWGHRWRGSQKFRYSLYNNSLLDLLNTDQLMAILDIGCALGDFTSRVKNLNPQNQVYGIDISRNAINLVAKKYPNINFHVAALPNLCFKENFFDVVLCLEVLYYLNPEEREISLKNIKNILRPNGHVLLSGVLDGAKRYFDEKQILELVSKYFNIMVIKYNYAKIYTILEAKFLALLSRIEIVKNLLDSDKNLFLDSPNNENNEYKAERVRRLRKILDKIPILKFPLRIATIIFEKIIRFFLSQEQIVKLFYWITKLTLKKKGTTQIIILAQKI